MAAVTRRQVVAGAAVLAGVGLVSRAPGVRAMPADQFEDLERRYGGRLGLYAANLTAPSVVTWRDGVRFAMCSTFKTYAAARVLQMTEQGQARLDADVAVSRSDLVANSPVTEPAAGSTLILGELCAAALQVSDNTAGNLLLRTIGGPPALTAFARGIGDDQTRLDRWETALNSAVPNDPRDTSTPAALAGGYRNLLEGDALGQASRQQLQEWMRANQTSSLRAGLPPGWVTADKTGSGDYGSTNDVGIAYGPDGQQVLLAIMTRSAADNPAAQDLRPMIAAVTTAVLPMLGV